MKRPTLHLRDLFWLVLVVALGLGWWIEAARLRNRNRVLEVNQKDLLKMIEISNCGFTPVFSPVTGEVVGTTNP